MEFYCVERTLPPELIVSAADKAVAENDENALKQNLGVGETPMPLTEIVDVIPADQTRFPPSIIKEHLALITGKKWRTGRTLRVLFMGGDPVVQDRTFAAFAPFSTTANIRLLRSTDPAAEIRISFTQGLGSWSHLGVDALSVPLSQATMNLGWLTINSPPEEYYVALYEMGHALGAIHEHQSPEAGISWNAEAVYRDLSAAPNFWSRPQVDANVFQKYSKSVTQFSQFDPKSVMIYPIPVRWTLNGFSVASGKTLSEIDKKELSLAYPFPAPPPKTAWQSFLEYLPGFQGSGNG